VVGGYCGCHHLTGDLTGESRRPGALAPQARKKARKPARKPAPAARANSAPAKAAAGGGISLEDVKAVKGLVDRLGADRVEELARVLGK
jgi:hypothetical protein